MSLADPVTFGLSLPNRAVLFGLPARDLLDSAISAERSGCFDSVWVGDNYLSKPRLEAMVTLGALAAVTQRVQLGTICMASFTLRDPLEFAIQWASLDRLASGRTILVVCIGGSDRMGPQYAIELEAFGRTSGERVGRMVEGIELLRAFWADAPVTHEGRFYRYCDVVAEPKPHQPRVPIGIAVNPAWNGDPAVEERALRRVARISDGWQTDGIPLHLFRERWRRVREYAEEYGRAESVRHCSLHLMVNIADDEQRALDETNEFMRRYYGAGTITEEKLSAWLAFGRPERVAEKVRDYVEAGCTTPVLRFTSPDQRAQLERCVAEVMPMLEDLRQA